MELQASLAQRIVDKSVLEWIYSQDNEERLEVYRENADYYDGDTKIRFPDPAIEMKLKEHGYRANVCKAVVDAAVGFLSREPISFETKVQQEDDNSREAVEKWIYEVFRNARLVGGAFTKALRIQGKKGELALKVYPELDANEQVVGYNITVLRPDICFPKWQDENFEEMEHFAIVYPRTNPNTKIKELFAQVWWPDLVVEYVKPINATAVEQWQEVRRWENHYKFIPIFWVANKEDDGPWSEADITSDLRDIQDFINKTLTDLAYTQDSESFRTGFILGAQPPTDPKTKEPIELKHQPGNLHWIQGVEGKNPTLGEFSPSNFEGFLKVMDKALEMVSVVTRVPKNELSIEGLGGAPSGLALRTVYQSFVSKTNEKRLLMAEGIERVAGGLVEMARADNLKIENANLAHDYSFKVYIHGDLPADVKEQIEVLDIELRNRIKSRETAMQEIGIEDIEKEKENIAGEMAELDIYAEEGRLEEELGALGAEEEPPGL